MDPVLGSVIVAMIAATGAFGTAVITARSSAERLTDKDRIRRLERHVERLGGDPDDA